MAPRRNSHPCVFHFGFQVEFPCGIDYSSIVSATEIAELCQSLPPDKREEVADFARFLLARQQDERWDAILADPKPRPRLDAFLRESAAEGAEALDHRRL